MVKGIILIILFISASCSPLRNRTTIPPEEAVVNIKKKIQDIESNEELKLRSIGHLTELYSQLGLKYLDLKLWDLSVEAYSTALKYGKREKGVYYSLGLGYANRGKELQNQEDLKKAEIFYEKALELDPEYYDVGYALSILLFFERQKKEKAIQLMEEMIRKKKAFYTARFALAHFYYDMKDISKAMAITGELCRDLARLPDSEIIIEYRKQCQENENRLLQELSLEKKGSGNR
jgi:tetratricopeptide (TPR) repeat protein